MTDYKVGDIVNVPDDAKFRLYSGSEGKVNPNVQGKKVEITGVNEQYAGNLSVRLLGETDGDPEYFVYHTYVTPFVEDVLPEPWKPTEKIKIKDIRVGDQIAVYLPGGKGGYEIDTVTNVGEDDSYIGYTIQTNYNAFNKADGPFYLLYRPVKELPTDTGSVITDATIRGESGHSALLIATGRWASTKPVDGYWSHPPESITDWTLGKIVADEA